MSDVVLFGEYHDDPVAHRLQHQLLGALAPHHRFQPTAADSCRSTSMTSAASPCEPFSAPQQHPLQLGYSGSVNISSLDAESSAPAPTQPSLTRTPSLPHIEQPAPQQPPRRAYSTFFLPATTSAQPSTSTSSADAQAAAKASAFSAALAACAYAAPTTPGIPAMDPGSHSAASIAATVETAKTINLLLGSAMNSFHNFTSGCSQMFHPSRSTTPAPQPPASIPEHDDDDHDGIWQAGSSSGAADGATIASEAPRTPPFGLPADTPSRLADAALPSKPSHPHPHIAAHFPGLLGAAGPASTDGCSSTRGDSPNKSSMHSAHTSAVPSPVLSRINSMDTLWQSDSQHGHGHPPSMTASPSTPQLSSMHRASQPMYSPSPLSNITRAGFGVAQTTHHNGAAPNRPFSAPSSNLEPPAPPPAQTRPSVDNIWQAGGLESNVTRAWRTFRQRNGVCTQSPGQLPPVYPEPKAAPANADAAPRPRRSFQLLDPEHPTSSPAAPGALTAPPGQIPCASETALLKDGPPVGVTQSAPAATASAPPAASGACADDAQVRQMRAALALSLGRGLSLLPTPHMPSPWEPLRSGVYDYHGPVAAALAEVKPAAAPVGAVASPLERAQGADGGAAARGSSATTRNVVLSLEMFETDVQPVVNEYLAGAIWEEDFAKDSRPWPNYVSDYRGLVEMAKAHRMPVVAANAPRRYVSMVGRNGPDALLALNPHSAGFLPPLPVLPPSEALADKVNRELVRAMAREPVSIPPSTPDAKLSSKGASRQVPSLDTTTSSSSRNADGRPMRMRIQSNDAVSDSTQRGAQIGSLSTQEPRGGMSANKLHSQSAPADSRLWDDVESRQLPEADEIAASSRVGSRGGPADEGPGCPHIGFKASSNFLAAQGLWDATMAHSIAFAWMTGRAPSNNTPPPHEANSAAVSATGAESAHICAETLSPRESRKPPRWGGATPHAAAAEHPYGSLSELLWGSPQQQSGKRSGRDSNQAPASASGSPSLAEPLPTLVLHVCGKFHVEQGLGIPEHLARYAPEARVMTVVSVPGDLEAWKGAAAEEAAKSRDVAGTGYSFLELMSLADYVVVGNASLPRSFSIDHPL